MIHELGHNYSRRHAPCGNVANPDASYPYANGALGPTPLFDSLANDVIAAANLTDIMGYCSGAWFSDYNLRAVQSFLEARPQPVTIASAGNAPAESIVIGGVIDASGVRLAPVRAQRGAAPLPQGGAYTLRLLTRSGAVVQVPFDPVEVDHAPGEMHFLLRVPVPGPLAAIEVQRGTERVPTVATAVGAFAQRGARVDAGTDAAVAAARDGDLLVVTWSAAAAPYVSVTAVAGDTRHTLALDARGGRVAAPLAGLPAGGHLEVALSDGLNTRVVIVPRP